MFEYLKHLKRQNKSEHYTQGGVWSIENLEAGFEKFYDEYGKYPSATDINKYEYLPSSKQIERQFGGVKKLRQDMNLRYSTVNYNEGQARGSIAGKAYKRSQDYEEKYYNYLISKFPELHIHEHKVIRGTGYRTDCDFFIYYPDGKQGLVIDVFYAKDIKSLQGQISLKIPKYSSLPYDVYFISVNDKIDQAEITANLKNRKSNLPQNIKVLTKDLFNQDIIPQIEILFNA